MPKKCYVVNCNSNYASDIKYGSKRQYSVYKFPKDIEKRKSWIKAIPNSNITVENITENQGVCEKHWTGEVKWIKKGKFPSPDQPPNDFSGCAPESSWGTPQPPPRNSKKVTSESRAVDIDEMAEFRAKDALNKESFKDTIEEKLNVHGIIVFI